MRSKRALSVRELANRASKILLDLRVKGVKIQIMDRGRVIAHLLSARPPRSISVQRSAVCSELDRLAAEIGARWPNDVSATDAVREARREL